MLWGGDFNPRSVDPTSGCPVWPDFPESADSDQWATLLQEFNKGRDVLGAGVTSLLAVPLAAVSIMVIFSIPFLPLSWAHSQHFTGFDHDAEFWSHGFEMATDFRSPGDPYSETQRRVLKLQLFLLALFAGFSYMHDSRR